MVYDRKNVFKILNQDAILLINDESISIKLTYINF